METPKMLAKHWVSYHLTPSSNGILLITSDAVSFKILGFLANFSSTKFQKQHKCSLKAAQLTKTVNLTGKIQFKGKTTIKQTHTTPKRGRKVVGTRSNQNSEHYRLLWLYRTHNQYWTSGLLGVSSYPLQVTLSITENSLLLPLNWNFTKVVNGNFTSL